MRVVAIAFAVLALLAVASAQNSQCLEACNQAMSQCLAMCPSQCPTDPQCMAQCYSTCSTNEAKCADACGPKRNVVHASFAETPKPVAKPAVAKVEEEVKLSELPEKHYQREFSTFVKKFNKKYTRDEFFPRYTVFKANYNFIRAHNAKKSSFAVGVNEFADMSFSEFHAKMTGYKGRHNRFARSRNTEGPHKHLKEVADSVDWRKKNAVTAVKNQGQCGSCWSFSTTGSVEGAHAIATGNLVSLSEQQLMDCSSAEGNQGCQGGAMDQAFQYIIQNGGITTEASYPYQGAVGNCETNVTVAATISSFVDVDSGDETALMQAVNIGPVSIAIEADQQCFQFYTGGILNNPACGNTLDHGVLVVGYGTDATTNTPYWIVKNSWGASWGESGYIRMIRGQDECGIADDPSYPVV